MKQRSWMRRLTSSDNQKPVPSINSVQALSFAERSKIQSPKWLGLSVLALVLMAAGAEVQAQQPGKIARIGILRPERPGDAGVEVLIEAFHRGLRQLGYVEGKNVVLEHRFAEGKLDRFPDLVAEFVRLKVDVIFALNTPAARAAKNGTKTIPIVFTWVADPLDLVASLARPGGNVTGLTTVSADLSGKRLEVLKEATPGVTRVGVLLHSDNPIPVRLFKDMENASPQFGIRLYSLGVRGPGELQKVFDIAAKERIGALFVIEEAVIASYRTRVLELAAKQRLPTASLYKEFAEAGGLLTYGADLPDLFRRAATYVDKILKGTKPADLPVEQPMKFEFVINLKAAKQIGLTIPPNVLARADKVIK
jgi:putative tryptophan/tyrosine transport system substrate-binding protein